MIQLKKIQINIYLDTMNPQGFLHLILSYSNTKSNIWAVNHIFNGLVELNENLNIVPSIAKSWEI